MGKHYALPLLVLDGRPVRYRELSIDAAFANLPATSCAEWITGIGQIDAYTLTLRDTRGDERTVRIGPPTRSERRSGRIVYACESRPVAPRRRTR